VTNAKPTTMQLPKQLSGLYKVWIMALRRTFATAKAILYKPPLKGDHTSAHDPARLPENYVQIGHPDTKLKFRVTA